MPRKENAEKARRRRRHSQTRREWLISLCVVAVVMLVLGIGYGILNGGARDMLSAPAMADSPQTPKYTPVPTPSPSPSPEPTPSPTPEPTPVPTRPDEKASKSTPISSSTYVFSSSGQTVNPDKKMIALTFDDGPSSKATERILKALDKYDAKATFFMLGDNAANLTTLAQKVASAGHQIGTHTNGHKSLIRLSAKEITKEINQSLDTIESASGVRPTILRPPYGNVNDTVRATVEIPMINWSVDTLDWDSRDAKQVYKHLVSDVKDGSIVLMHDLYTSTAEALEKALPKLKEKGYQFVTIDELFANKGLDLEGGTVYYSGIK